MQENLRKPVIIDQRTAVLIDGNNCEIGIHEMFSKNHVINFDEFVPNILKGRKLSHLSYFREGKSISPRLAERLQKNFFGTVTPCWKSADIALTIEAVQLVDKVDTIIICSGDSDYIPLIEHLKSRGIRVEIAATDNGLSPYVAKKADAVYKITAADCFCLYDKRDMSPASTPEDLSGIPKFTQSHEGDVIVKFNEPVRIVCNNDLTSEQTESISETV